MVNVKQSVYDLGYRVTEFLRKYIPSSRVKELKEHYPFHREQEFDIDVPKLT